MSERKLLTQYIPKDFDPSQLPVLSRDFNNTKSRIMIPFTCQCLTCGAEFGTSKKFNATKEYANEMYLGIKIWRFWFRCSNCTARISFKTDPATRGYVLETGAQRTMDKYLYNIKQREAAEKAAKDAEFQSNVAVIEQRIASSAGHTADLDVLEQMFAEKSGGGPSVQQLQAFIASEQAKKDANSARASEGDDLDEQFDEKEFEMLQKRLLLDKSNPNLAEDGEINGLDCLFVQDDSDYEDYNAKNCENQLKPDAVLNNIEIEPNPFQAPLDHTINPFSRNMNNKRPFVPHNDQGTATLIEKENYFSLPLAQPTLFKKQRLGDVTTTAAHNPFVSLNIMNNHPTPPPPPNKSVNLTFDDYQSDSDSE